ncbi:terminase small subunit [Aureimonas glaciei]|uniref:Terminase small subunit n=1 Tax=Aureimonas glaciei TaxID=1776957 RepID=A0A916YG92_9HYPH|nr:terminase small subunit [Aureimonas glaciei]GGD43371.1 hypothetical protein GCM10011335_52520 [Aureimonas glaciei]
MPALSNPKHELFASSLAKGMSATDAYAKAGYKPNRSHASRLVANGNVRKRVAELQRRAAGRAKVTIQTIADQLDEDRNFAREQGNAQAAMSATMNKAKLLGLYSERRELSGPGGSPIQTVDLTGATDDQLAALESIFGPLAARLDDHEADPGGEGEAPAAG